MGSPELKNGIHIVLDNPARSYFAGQVIQGCVIVQYDKPQTAKEVTLLLEGSGRVKWSERVDHNQRSDAKHTKRVQTVYFNSEEKYIHMKLSLAGDGHNLMTIPEGRHTYPFQLILPTSLPSSFTSKTGVVSYFLEAKLRRPFLKLNQKIVIPFTVNGIFDLNLELGVVQAYALRKSKGANFFACRKGEMGFVLKLQRSGFVSGESINFNCGLTNSSSRKVKSVKASIIQVTKFYAQGKSKTMEKTVYKLEGPAVESGDYEMWRPRNFQIPSLPPSRLDGCRIIDVNYFFRLDMHVSGLSSTLTGTLPIIIGTIPLRNTFDSLRRPPLSNAGIGFQVPLPGPSSASALEDLQQPLEISDTSQLPPPTYAEAVISNPWKTIILTETTTGIPSAPPFINYPDLPPPTYSEAVMSEPFIWEGIDDDNEHNAQALSSADNVAQSSSSFIPSAPSLNEYVPNYITYQQSHYM